MSIEITTWNVEYTCPFNHKDFECSGPHWWPCYGMGGRMDLEQALNAIVAKLAEDES